MSEEEVHEEDGGNSSRCRRSSEAASHGVQYRSWCRRAIIEEVRFHYLSVSGERESDLFAEFPCVRVVEIVTGGFIINLKFYEDKNL